MRARGGHLPVARYLLAARGARMLRPCCRLFGFAIFLPCWLVGLNVVLLRWLVGLNAVLPRWLLVLNIVLPRWLLGLNAVLSTPDPIKVRQVGG